MISTKMTHESFSYTQPIDLRELLDLRHEEQTRVLREEPIRFKEGNPIERLTLSPLSLEIEMGEPLKKFSIFKFNLYDGWTNPYDHLSNYRHLMVLW